MYKSLICLVLVLSFNLAKAQNPDTYIREYKDIAIAEMIRTGIPASIKLAQAMVESNCGTSELARKANNHFGIKCGGDWTGKGFHKEDDDYKNGELTKSCFREFDSAYESFVAHSDFLVDPKKCTRYGCLFQLKPTDYKGWAKGLSKSGYASDPAYADKLIKIIEDNQLYQFDDGRGFELASASPSASMGHTMVRLQNDVKYAVAMADDQLTSMAERYDVSEQQLMRFNDNAFSKNQILTKGTKVYLQPKRNSYSGKQKSYVIKSGEDLLFVAQEYGIKLSALEKRNGIASGRVPVKGQKIMLRGKATGTVKTADPYELPVEQTVVTTKPVVSTDTIKSKSPASSVPAQSKPVVAATKPQPSGTSMVDAQHVVSKGDTLYSIANQFGLSVDELKKNNNLSVDTIFIGQKLVIK